MPEAQPGQEQRMGPRTLAEQRRREKHWPHCGVQGDGPCDADCLNHEQSRPTADLGDDGELVERLRRTEKRKSYVATNRTAPVIENEYDALINPDGPEAADRIELYREALGDAQEQVGAYGYRTVRGRRVRQSWAAELLAKISAVLSRASP